MKKKWVEIDEIIHATVDIPKELKKYDSLMKEKPNFNKSKGGTKNNECKKASRPIKDIQEIYDIQDYLKSRSERDYVLFVLGITTGYRAGDLVSLKVRDVKKAILDGRFIILEGKKKNSKNVKKKNLKAREAEVLPELEKVLMQYIKYKEDYEYMFPSRKGEHITVDRVTRILKDAADFFGLKKITAHSMRKTYAYTVYVNSGNDFLAVKEMLGHSSVEETKLYLGLDRELYHQYSQPLRKLVRI